MSGTVVFIASDFLGSSDEELGRALMLAAIKNLGKLPGGPPSHLLFMNDGVRLCCEGSKALDDLAALAAAGTELWSCGTCLDWFELTDSVAVGRVNNMVEILGAMDTAGRVIRF